MYSYDKKIERMTAELYGELDEELRFSSFGKGMDDIINEVGIDWFVDLVEDIPEKQYTFIELVGSIKESYNFLFEFMHKK